MFFNNRTKNILFLFIFCFNISYIDTRNLYDNGGYDFGPLNSEDEVAHFGSNIDLTNGYYGGGYYGGGYYGGYDDYDPHITPTENPTYIPTLTPTENPTYTPTEIPSYMPTLSPSWSQLPSSVPSSLPTFMPITSKPTLGPTEVPTFHPTTPTYAPSEPNVVTFDAFQIIYEVNSTYYNNYIATSNSVIVKSIEMCLYKLAPLNDVTITNLYQSINITNGVLYLDIHISYVVIAPLVDSQITAYEGFNLITEELIKEVENGNFTKILQNNSYQYGNEGKAFTLSHSNKVLITDTNPYPMPPGPPESNDDFFDFKDKYISSYEIVAFGITITFGFLFCIAIYYSRNQILDIMPLSLFRISIITLLDLLGLISSIISIYYKIQDGFYIVVFGLLFSRLFVLGSSFYLLNLITKVYDSEVNKSGLKSFLIFKCERLIYLNTTTISAIICMIMSNNGIVILPWRNTKFTLLSGGYPNYYSFKFCLLSECFTCVVIIIFCMVSILTENTTTSIIVQICQVIIKLCYTLTISWLVKASVSEKYDIDISFKKKIINCQDINQDYDNPIFAEKNSITTYNNSDLTLNSNPFDIVIKNNDLDNDVNDNYGDQVDNVSSFGNSSDLKKYESNLPNPDETNEILIEQLKLAGIKPLEFIPLEQIHFEINQLIVKINEGKSTYKDDSRLEYLTNCLEINPIYRQQQIDESKKWRQEVEIYSKECLEIMRGFIPPHIFVLTKSDIISEGISEKLAKRLFQKKVLWLLRLESNKINSIHEVEFQTKYVFQAQGLDIVEIAAIYAILPIKFTNDLSGKKEKWRVSLEMLLKAMIRDYKLKTLPLNKVRHPFYELQDPVYLERKTLYEPELITGSAFEPRYSFTELASISTTKSQLSSNSSFLTSMNGCVDITDRKKQDEIKSITVNKLDSNKKSFMTTLQSKLQKGNQV